MNEPTTASDLQPPRRPFLQRLAEVALIVLAFFVVAGDPPPHVNEPHYLARLKHFWNPDWCTGDFFLDSADTQVAFIWTFGWVTRWLSLPATAWVGRFLAWILLAWAWQRLSWRIVPRRLASVLSASLFVTLIAVAHLAGEWVVGGVEAKCFAHAFVLLALRELVEKRWNAVWFLLGTACAFHPLVGGWSALLCGGIWLIDDRRQVGLLSMIPGVVAGGLLALVGVLPALMLTSGVTPDMVDESARIYVFERLPHHLAPLTLPREEIANRLARHVALVASLWALGLFAKRHLVVPSAVAPPDLAGLRRIGQFAWGAILLALIGFAIEILFWNQPLVAARLLRYYWFRMTDFAVPMAVALYLVAIIASGLECRRTWAMWSLTIALALVGWQLSSTARQRAIHPVPPADAKVENYPAWVEACEWIAENTPPNARFLTPRSSLSFKWRTGRPEVVTRKDIPQDARNMVEWFERMKNIFGHDPVGDVKWIDSPADLGTERILRLADEYGFDYVLTNRSQLLSLPVAYKNEDYVVYRIKK